MNVGTEMWELPAVFTSGPKSRFKQKTTTNFRKEIHECGNRNVGVWELLVVLYSGPKPNSNSKLKKRQQLI